LDLNQQIEAFNILTNNKPFHAQNSNMPSSHDSTLAHNSNRVRAAKVPFLRNKNAGAVASQKDKERQMLPQSVALVTIGNEGMKLDSVTQRQNKDIVEHYGPIEDSVRTSLLEKDLEMITDLI
jgi:hypothetical protein